MTAREAMVYCLSDPASDRDNGNGETVTRLVHDANGNMHWFTIDAYTIRRSSFIGESFHHRSFIDATGDMEPEDADLLADLRAAISGENK